MAFNILKEKLSKNNFNFDDIQNNLHFHDFVKNEHLPYNVLEFEGKFIGIASNSKILKPALIRFCNSNKMHSNRYF